MIIAAAAVAALAAWATFGALALIGPGPSTARVGLLPSWWVLAGLLAMAAIVSLFPRGPERPAAPRHFTSAFVLLTSYLALILLPWLPIPVPRAFLVWTGPVAAAVWAGVAAAVVLARVWGWRTRVPALADPSRAPWIAAAAGAAFFSAIAVGAAPMVPGGDEPHYLIITQSLLSDGDLKIENNHARRDYAPYFDGTLRPDYMVRGKDGEIYSIHAPGLSALIAPFFALGGYRAVVIFLIVLSAAGVGLLWKLAYTASGDAGAAWFGACATSCATPVAFHAFAIYPDSAAWVLALTGVLALMRLDSRAEAGGRGSGATGWVWMLHGAGLALLPWIHSRFAWLAACFGFFILLRLSACARPSSGGLVPRDSDRDRRGVVLVVLCDLRNVRSAGAVRHIRQDAVRVGVRARRPAWRAARPAVRPAGVRAGVPCRAGWVAGVVARAVPRTVASRSSWLFSPFPT